MALYTFGGSPAAVLTDDQGNVVPDYPVIIRVADTGQQVTALYEDDGITPIGELRSNPASDPQPGAIRPFKCAQKAIQYEYLDAGSNPVRWYEAGRELATEANETAATALSLAEGALPTAGGIMTGPAQWQTTASGDTTASARATTDAYDRWRRDAEGRHSWGPGNATPDVSLYRSGPGELTIDGALVVSGGLGGFHNVREAGATGDGVTDDAPAIQDALMAAYNEGGGWVMVPAGDYLLATLPLRIRGNTRLTLAPGARFLRGASGTLLINGDADQLLGGYTGHGHILIEGGTWDMRAVDFPSSAMCISIGHARNVTIRDLEIRDVAGYHGVELNSTQHALVDNCAFRGYLDPDGTRDFSEAVQIDGAFRASVFGGFGPYDHTVCQDVTVRGCYVGASDTPGTVAWPAGVGSHSTTAGHPHKRITVEGNTVEGSAQYGVKPYCWDDSSVIGNRIIGCGAGIWLRTLDSSKTADRTDETGVDTGASAPNSGFVIARNVIRNLTGFDDAIRAEGEATGHWSDLSIHGNVIVSTAGTRHGVRLYYADHSVVEGNTFHSIGGTALSTANCTFGSLVGNRAYDCGASFVTCDTDTDMLVADNHLALCQTHGVWLFGGARLKVADNYVKGAGRADGTGNGYRITSNLARLTLTGNTYQAWGSGTEATTAIYLSSTVTGVRRFGNDVLGQAATPISDSSVSPNLSPYDAGTP
ncbi:right-handed parallel beta-helix repeat-containing protein [Streptomyces sp. B15]|uniref:right-handed parallel beta-helix repeat-containing protein n=1 Tax=Streptomyces sp. B15 TaxID=1537797 RepID=UPI001B397BC8|nr:right-handed parallel beta-helix repeat-containing protein [Streptomyces sp. B15]MBQ1122654.1 right-handed parallel beta-helix repeat-containing protein [Streptomyces sp. B15]